MAGVVGSVIGWALVEPWFREGGCAGRWGMGNAFFFPVVAGMICAALVFAESWPRGRQTSAASLACAGFGAGFGLGFLLQIPAHMLFAWLRPLADYSLQPGDTGDWWLALTARCLAWGGLGITAGLAAGIVTGNWRVCGPAVMGGLFGGLVAGFSFNAIQFWLHPAASGSAWASRVTGFAMMGGMAGLGMGVASDMVRQGRLVVLSGCPIGTQVLLDAAPCLIGTSRECSVVLPEDHIIFPVHAVIEKVGFGFEIQPADPRAETLVNGRHAAAQRLVDGDRILIGHTKLAFFAG